MKYIEKYFIVIVKTVFQVEKLIFLYAIITSPSR